MLSNLPKATQLGSNTVKLDSRSVCVMQRTPPQLSPVMHQGLEQILQHRMGCIKEDALLKKGGTHMGQGSSRSEKSGSPQASHGGVPMVPWNA